MNERIARQGLADCVSCDSAGIGLWHVGEPADARMRQHAVRRGYDLESMARQIDAPRDLANFDYIIAMDDKNLSDLTALDTDGRFRRKIHKFTDFCCRHTVAQVPDPYYGSDWGFEQVLDILEDGCDGLLEAIMEDG